MDLQTLRRAAFLGLTGVMLGAFATHGLAPHLSPEQLSSFQVGVRYQVWHALALLLTVSWPSSLRLLRPLRQCWFYGSVIFSGSIYLLACKTLLAVPALRFLGPVTPLGGLSLMVGWGMLFLVRPFAPKSDHEL